jgi:hypothetical protein
MNVVIISHFLTSCSYITGCFNNPLSPVVMFIQFRSELFEHEDDWRRHCGRFIECVFGRSLLQAHFRTRHWLFNVFYIFFLEEKYYAREFECAQALTNQIIVPAKTQFNVNPNLKYPQTISGVGRLGPSPPILPSRSSPSCT